MGKKPAARQPSPMWVTTADLPTSAGHPFFERLNQVMEEAGFDAFVEGLCAVFYASRLGRPSLRRPRPGSRARPGPEVYRFMSANQARFRIATMARVLGVSTSGYYAWRQRPPSARPQADANLTVRVQAIHAHSCGTYAAPLIHAELSEAGVAGESQARGAGVALGRHCGREPSPRPAHDAAGCTGPAGSGSGRAPLRGGRAESPVGCRHHLHPDPRRLPLPGHRPRRVQPAGRGLSRRPRVSWSRNRRRRPQTPRP